MLPVSMCKGPGPFGGSRDLCSWVVESSRQSAGVGGTVSRLVPWPGGRLVRTGKVGASPVEGLPAGRLRLWDRAEAGGGPGGGGGSGIPGSHVGGERLVERDPFPARPIPPVEAALLAAGARDATLSVKASGDCTMTLVLLTCNVLNVLPCGAAPVVSDLEAMDGSVLFP